MGKNEYPCRECCSVDINKLEEILEPTTNCCIYRVPQFLRKINEEAYSPRLISIGPLHYQSRDDLRGMENQKRSYLLKFRQRQEVGIQKLDYFKAFIEDEEGNIRDHYSVSSILGSTEYVEMVLYDAVFIIELFLRNDLGPNDFLLDKSQLRTYITLDLLLLENQLPYFVLDHIYSSAFPQEPSFFALCHKFFSSLVMFNWPSSSEQTQVKHFTDLLRYAAVQRGQPKLEPKSGEIFILPYVTEQSNDGELSASASATKQSNNGDQPSASASATKQSNNGETSDSASATKQSTGEISDLPNATKLNESGLKFTKIKGDCLLDIRLRKRLTCGIGLPWLEETELQIPCIEIYDDTECFFRNMMALELFHYPTETYVCHYADLMCYLIDTGKDVDLLIKEEVIVNCVGNTEAIAKMFRNLCSYITLSPSCYYKIAEKMKAHMLYYYSWNQVKTLKIAVTFLLTISLIQTICSIVQVYQGYTLK